MSRHEQANILMVDDQPGKLLSYEAILRDLDENLIQARSAREALDVLLRQDVAVVLMDVSMPDIDGFELADMMHQHPRFQKIAIIFISAVHLTDLDRIKGYQSGAVDYISVPVVPEVLRAKVSVFAELHRKTRQLEQLNRELEQRVEERTEEIRELNSQLEQRIAELETIMQVLPVGVAVSQDPECRSITCNAALSELFGVEPGDNMVVTKDEIQGRPFEIYQQGRRLEIEALPLQMSAKTGQQLGSMELEIRRVGGDSSYLLANAIPLFREDGKVRGAVGAFFDMTRRKQLENLLRERADLLELATEAVMVRDMSGVLRYWNAGAEALYGWRREDVLGKKIDDVLHTRVQADGRGSDGVDSALAENGRWSGDLIQVTRDGIEIVVASRQALKEDGSAVLEINRDITAQLRAEDALRRTERLAAMGRVAGVIAHEINNPLESITNTFYLLRQHPSLDDEARYYAKLGEEELIRVSHITRQTLGFYRESKDPVEVSLSELLDEILEFQARRLEISHIAIDKKYLSRGAIQGFPGELKQVFLNLIGNAVQAMPDGGRLRLRVSEASCRNGRNAGFFISVTDTGSGIPPEHAKHLFEPFFTTKSNKGTGLGLWISKGIVQKYGGSIRFRSCQRPGGNATSFQVFLPHSHRNATETVPPVAQARSSQTELMGKSSGRE
ncbi:MAG TPA: ATP-binding protein [Acidobacteriaceae bacterium]|nr:ATP-binding protein [Acidobacteriaceae bacterium]